MCVVKWYRLLVNQHDPDRTIIEHYNGLTMVNTRLFEPRMEPYVVPSQWEQVFYLKVLAKAGWSFVVRHDPRGMPVKYNLDDGNEQGYLEEEDDDEEHDQHKLDYDDDPTKDVQELVESYDVVDNAHEYDINDDMMIVTDLDDDYDMDNPQNVDSGSDDMNDDLDEGYDEVY